VLCQIPLKISLKKASGAHIALADLTAARMVSTRLRGGDLGNAARVWGTRSMTPQKKPGHPSKDQSQRSARSTRSTAKGKGQSDFSDWPLFNAGNDLLSHTLSRAVQSALRGLTSVFGMGTGGTPAVRSPTSRSCQLSAVSSQLLAGANVSC
jgi:hypothetical protein